jgi:hypothetical protein
MKAATGMCVWVVATYVADQVLFYGFYYATASRIIHQIVLRVI